MGRVFISYSLMPDLFLTTKFIAHMPIYFPENTGFSRYVPPYGSSGKVMRGARLHMSGAIIVGVGYRF